MEFKGTKGEWEIYGISDDLMEVYSNETKTPIFDIQPYTKKSESHANAKLIACAPEMLNFIIEMAKRYPNSEWISKEANELIKKATTI